MIVIRSDLKRRSLERGVSSLWIECGAQCLRVDSDDSELLGLALDSERGLLYYTDTVQGVIAEISTSGLDRREIFSDSNTNPRAIVVDPVNRWTKSLSLSHMSHSIHCNKRYIL